MVHQHSRACKRKSSFAGLSDKDYEKDPISNDSKDDEDYIESGSNNVSEKSDSETNENDTVTPQSTRSALLTQEKKPLTRWKVQNTQRRKKCKRKTKRNLGHSYVNTKGREVAPKTLGLPCNCPKKCRQRLNEHETQIFNAFWNLGYYDKQNIYLFSSIKVIPKKRDYPKKTKKQHSSRKISVQYRVKMDSSEIKICKKEFLAVHGLSKKRIERLIDQAKEGATTPRSDKRGKHGNNNNKIPEKQCENVRKHINSIPKYTSHYSRQKNPAKVYLDSDLFIAALYNNYYLEWCQRNGVPPVTEDKYRRIFCTEYNIGFKMPKSDTCKVCDFLNNKICSEANMEAVGKLKVDLELHQRRAQAMKDKMTQDIEDAKTIGDLVISFDLQQAMPVPSLTFSTAFYLRKAWVYNLGIHDCVTGKSYMYMWSENVAKRGSDEVCSILYKHFKANKPTAYKLIVYTDNCSGQNKNWSLICLWQQLIIERVFTSIEHKYLVVGHTRLPCDRDIAAVEKYRRCRLKHVYTPEDWYEAVKKCKRKNPFEVIVLKQEDIFSFKDLQNAITKKTFTDDKEKVNFFKVSSFKFSSEQPNIMFIKHFVNDTYNAVNIGKKGLKNSILLARDSKSKYKEPIPLNKKKKNENLSQLVEFIPPAFLKFYEEIGACQQAHPYFDNELLDNVENLDDFSDTEENTKNV